MAKTLCVQHREYFDGEIRGKRPGGGVVHRRALSSGSLRSLQEGRTHLDCALDGTVLLRVQDPGIKKALEGEIESEGRVGEGEEVFQEAVHGGGVRRNPRASG